MICLILLLCAAQVERDEIYIGLNSSFNSELLKDELTRDWTQYNPEANLTISQIEEVKKQGEYYNKIRDELCSDFHFVDYLKTPNEIRKYPCIKVGKYGVWKEIDERAFLTSTFPLLTVIALADDSPKGLARQLRRYEKLVELNKAECELVRKHNSSIMKQFYPLHENFNFHRKHLLVRYLDKDNQWKPYAGDLIDLYQNDDEYKTFFPKGEIVQVQGFITKQGQFGLIYTTEDLEMPKELLQYPEDIPPFVYMNSRFPWE
jgi:hypothetical protein